jgi:hypothetical protein
MAVAEKVRTLNNNPLGAAVSIDGPLNVGQ